MKRKMNSTFRRRFFFSRSFTMLVVLIGGTTFAAAQPAYADEAGPHFDPAYYLYTESTNIEGPCFSKPSASGQIGEVSIANRSYRTVSAGTFNEGDIEYKYYIEYGFNKAYKYSACGDHGVGVVYKYYGANDGKISRKRTDTLICAGGGCQYTGHSYNEWTRKDW
jgi:hypothetical protein